MLDLHTCCVYLLCQEECLLAGCRQVPGNLACGTCVGRCGAKGAFDAEQYALTRKQQMTCQMQKFGRAPTRLQRGRRRSACGGIRAQYRCNCRSFYRVVAYCQLYVMSKQPLTTHEVHDRRSRRSPLIPRNKGHHCARECQWRLLSIDVDK